MITPLVTVAPDGEARRIKSADKQILELDGVRGIAIFLVIAYHFGNFSPNTELDWAVWQVAGLGWSGVDLFFVLSGFLITNILLRTKHTAHYFQNFYARRVLRIFPLYFAYIFVAFYVALPLAHRAGQWVHYSTHGELWYWLYLANWPIAHRDAIAPVSHLWSLSIEEQFYMLWPLIVFSTRRSTLLRICLGLVLGTAILRFCFASDPVLIYNLTPFRLDGLALGAAIAAVRGMSIGVKMYKYSRAIVIITPIVLLGIFIIAGSTFGYVSPTNTVGFTLLAMFYAAVIFRCVENAGSRDWLCRAMRVRALRSVGKYSYGMYILHIPILLGLQGLTRRYGESWLGSGHVLWAVALELIVGFAAIYGCAFLSWNLFEQRFLRLKERFSYGSTMPLLLRLPTDKRCEGQF